MRVGVIQSSFIPWRGYFDFIASVDLFVFHDDIQYTKSDWRNRNRIKTRDATQWLTVPVHYKTSAQLICNTEIDNSTDWKKKHLRQWQTHYRKAPFLDDVLQIHADLPQPGKQTISHLNIELSHRICRYLGIATPTLASMALDLNGSKTERLIDLLRKVGGKTYLSGPSAESYLDKELFRRHGIRLEFKSYDYDPYPQLWGDFEGAVSVLDLIANCGPQARTHLTSKTPNRVIVS